MVRAWIWDKPPRKAWPLNMQNNSLPVDVDFEQISEVAGEVTEGLGRIVTCVNLLIRTFFKYLSGTFNMHNPVLTPEGRAHAVSRDGQM